MSVTISSLLTGNKMEALEVQRTNNGKLFIMGLSAFNHVANGSTALTGSGTANDSFDNDVLALSADKFDLPTFGGESKDLFFGNEVRKFAARATYDDLTVGYKDLTVNAHTATILYNWRCAANNPVTGTIGYQWDYKMNGFGIVYDTKGANARLFRLIGCWPKSFKAGAIDQSGDAGFNTIDLTLALDKAVYVGVVSSLASAETTYAGAWDHSGGGNI